MGNYKRDRRGDGFEDVSSFSSRSQYNKTKKAKRGRHRGLKVFFGTLCVLLIVVGAGTVYAGSYLFGGLSTNKITKDKEALGIASGVTSNPKITNIALFGLDSRGDNFKGRSDAVMVLSIDQIHDKVKLTSILRDSNVYMGEGYEGTYDGYDKIAHAYAFGGPELAIRVLNTNFHLNIEDYVTVNFSGLAQIVDAFGGVDIEVTDAEIEHINGNLEEIIRKGLGASESDYMYDASSGLIHLNGAQAVAYSRIRKLDSDNKRAERQQIVLSAVMEKGKSLSAVELPGVVNQLCSMSETSLDVPEILGYAPFAVTGFSVEKMVIPGEDSPSGYNDSGAWVWMLDTDEAAIQIENFIYEGDHLPQ